MYQNHRVMSAYGSFYPALLMEFPVISKSSFGVWLKRCLLYLPLIHDLVLFLRSGRKSSKNSHSKHGGLWDFLGGLVSKISCSAGGMSLTPDGGTKIQHAAVQPKSRKQNNNNKK